MKRRFFAMGALASLVLAVSACGDYFSGRHQHAVESGSVHAARRGDQSSHLVIGVEENFPPMEFRDASGTLVGYDVDLAGEVLKRAGVEFEFRSIDWGNKENLLLKDKAIDILWSGVFITDERKKVFAFSEPYLKSRLLLVVPLSSPVTSSRDLAGRKVAHVYGSFTGDVLKDFPRGSGERKAQIVEKSEAADAMSSMLAGEVDAFMGEETSVLYYVARSPGKFRILEESFGEYGVGVAVRPEDTDLLAKINKGLEAVKADGTAQSIYSRWFDKK